MNQEVKAQWLAALRSGEYKQGRDRLVTVSLDGSAKHCCLGVLCDLAVKAGERVDVKNIEFPHATFVTVEFDGQRYGLPESVSNWAGIEYGEHGTEVLWEIDGESRRVDVANLNDDGVTFTEIANLIEENL